MQKINMHNIEVRKVKKMQKIEVQKVTIPHAKNLGLGIRVTVRN